MIRSTALLALAITIPLAFAAPASASPITLDRAVSGNVHGANGSAAVTITGISGQVSAGGFDVQVTSGSHGIAHMANRFTAWCLDIANALKLASDYEVTTTPFTIDPLTSSQKGSIRALFNTGYIGGPVANNAASAGFQLALWEIVNETTGTFNLGTGSFVATGNNAAVAAANTLLADLAQPASNNWRVIYLESLDGPDSGSRQDSQNLVTVAAVPLPAAGFLLLGALGAMGLARRRRRA